MTISSGEIRFFNKIKDNCNVIFDIGCKDDTHYIEVTENKEFHLFEPNLITHNKCNAKLYNLINNTNKIFLNFFGLGNKSEFKYYYEDSESFIKRKIHFVSKTEPIKLFIKKFSDYILENKIENIDFIKIDTEGYEPDILLDDIDFIKNKVKYIQFEYASTWLDRDTKIELNDIINIFHNEFDFYFLYNEYHPLSKFFNETLTSIKNLEMKLLIEILMKNAYGFEIVMIKKAK